MDGKPRASGVMDTVSLLFTTCTFTFLTLGGQIRAALAHGIKIPPEFEEKSVIDTIVRVSVFTCTSSYADHMVWCSQEQAVVAEWFAGNDWSFDCSTGMNSTDVFLGCKKFTQNILFAKN